MYGFVKLKFCLGFDELIKMTIENLFALSRNPKPLDHYHLLILYVNLVANKRISYVIKISISRIKIAVKTMLFINKLLELETSFICFFFC